MSGVTTVQDRINVWVALVVGVILAGISVLAVVSFVGNAATAGERDYQGPGALGGSLLAAASFAAFVLLVAWLIHLEHQLRTLPRGFAENMAVRRRLRRQYRGRYAPVIVVMNLATTVGVFIFFSISAAQLHSQAVRSEYVQQNGLDQDATVVSVQNIDYRGTYRALVTVNLPAPVNEQATAIVHVRARSGLVRGEKVGVLVDPREPGYAEFSGAPYVVAWQWIALAVGASIFGLFSLGSIALVVRLPRRRRRSMPAQHAAHHGSA